MYILILFSFYIICGASVQTSPYSVTQKYKHTFYFIHSYIFMFKFGGNYILNIQV